MARLTYNIARVGPLHFSIYSYLLFREEPPVARGDHRRENTPSTMARLASKFTVVAAALIGTTLASSCHTNTGLTQMITHVKRHSNYTLLSPRGRAG